MTDTFPAQPGETPFALGGRVPASRLFDDDDLTGRGEGAVLLALADRSATAWSAMHRPCRSSPASASETTRFGGWCCQKSPSRT